MILIIVQILLKSKIDHINFATEQIKIRFALDKSCFYGILLLRKNNGHMEDIVRYDNKYVKNKRYDL